MNDDILHIKSFNHSCYTLSTCVTAKTYSIILPFTTTTATQQQQHNNNKQQQTTTTITSMTMNPDLKRERNNATFDVERITHVLDGDKDKTERRRFLESVIERDPTGIFNNDDNHYLHRTDRHKRGIAKGVRLIEICRKLGIGDECEGRITESKDFQVISEAVADDIPLALHWVMFQPNIVSLCDEEQQSRWLPLCRDWKMIGCYAQTELGHGSNIRALETTATFVSELNGGGDGGSFVINS